MAETNTEQVTLIEATFTANYRGSLGTFNAGETYKIKSGVFTALNKADICKKAETAAAK